MLEFMKVYARSIVGAISGWDRIRFRGTIRWLASTRGINTYMSSCSILMKDFGRWAEAVTGQVRALCSAQAERLGIPVVYLRSSAVDKEAYARRLMEERGVATGSICMLSVVEPCLAPVVRGNRSTRHLEVEMAPRKCVWIYHYWNDDRLGFGHTRLQTWLPLSVTVCINGRHWLERQLIREKIGYLKDGNCFTHLDDFVRGEELVQEQQRSNWSALLDSLLQRSCPGLGSVLGQDPLTYYWSADETEWATDVVFRSGRQLDALFPKLARYGLLSAQSPAVMRFLGKSNRGRCPNEVASDLRRRYEGLRLKHWINNNSVKLYNKAGNVLRVETTINQTRDFKVFRRPDDDPTRSPSWQKMRKGVSDLHRRAKVSQAANERYLDHLAAASVAESLQETVGNICRRIRRDGRTYRAINPWDPDDFQTLQFLARGEFQINGFRNAHLCTALYGNTEDPAEHKRRAGKVSRRLRLLRAHGLIRKVPTTNRYQLTPKGHRIAAAVLAASAVDTQRLMEMVA